MNYRDHLNKTDPVHDFVEKVKWASNHYKSKDQALFLLAYGGLGLYGGHNDIFIFIQNVMRELGEDYIVIGAQEMVRLAKEQCKKSSSKKIISYVFFNIYMNRRSVESVF